MFGILTSFAHWIYDSENSEHQKGLHIALKYGLPIGIMLASLPAVVTAPIWGAIFLLGFFSLLIGLTS